jgi:hypothetical protein
MDNEPNQWAGQIRLQAATLTSRNRKGVRSPWATLAYAAIRRPRNL